MSIRQITTPSIPERRTESRAAAIAARRAERRETPTVILATANLRRVLREDARTGHACSVAAAVGICVC